MRLQEWFHRRKKDLIETVQALEQRGIELKSLKENIDTTTPTGKLMFHLMAALVEFERYVIRERTLAGLDAARTRVMREVTYPTRARCAEVAASRRSHEATTKCASVRLQVAWALLAEALPLRPPDAGSALESAGVLP